MWNTTVILKIRVVMNLIKTVFRHKNSGGARNGIPITKEALSDGSNIRPILSSLHSQFSA